MSTAAERELREECGLDLEDVLRTRLLGYARWLEHGGKPEFFLVTHCDLEADEIRRRRRTPDEDELVGFVRCIRLDGNHLRAHPEEPRGALPEDLVSAPSVPLLAALRALGYALADEPGLLSGGSPTAEPTTDLTSH